jgi:tetratricopeptide (TPR) repeat protein
VNRAEADRLLELARRAEWAFPTSYGEYDLAGPGADWLEPLQAESDELASAVRFLMAEGDETAATELAARTWRLWLMAHDHPGVLEFLAPVLDGGGEASAWRAEALYGAGLAAIKDVQRDASLAYNEEAFAIAEETGDPSARVFALVGLSRVAFDDDDLERSRALAQEALDIARGLRIGMRQAPLFMTALATRMSGDLDAAAALMAENLELNRSIGDARMVAADLQNLGLVQARRGRYDEAERLFAEWATSADLDDPYGAALSSLDQAFLALGRGNMDEAAEHTAAARATLAETGTELAPDDGGELDYLEQRIEENRR